MPTKCKGVHVQRYAQTIEMVKMRRRGKSYRRIAMRFNVEHSTVFRRIKKFTNGLYKRHKPTGEEKWLTL